MGAWCTNQPLINEDEYKRAWTQVFESVPYRADVWMDASWQEHREQLICLTTACEVEYLFGGGFYDFEIGAEGGTYRVQILIPSIDNYANLQQMRRHSEVRGPVIDVEQARRVAEEMKANPASWEELKESLNGLGRITFTSDDTVYWIKEGQLQAGELQGFGRHLFIEDN